jgi:hypothetical protein
MLSPDFAQAYPIDMTPAEIHRGAHSQYMTEAQDYSYQWGRMMHAILRVDGSIQAFENQGQRDGLVEYLNWLRQDGGIGQTVAQLDEAPTEVRNHGLNELNFHALNAHMSDLVIPMASGAWASDAERYDIVNRAQDSLALTVMDHYMERENIISAGQGTEVLYDESQHPDIVAEHATITGVMQEYDAAIILLDLVRKNKRLSVVPAPMQFERTRKRTNVDFIVMDCVDRCAVGVQVKSRLRTEDTEGADPDRVVFLDGDTDLGNIKVVRTQRGRSIEQVRAWPGIIGVKHVNLMKNYGPRGKHLASYGKAIPLFKQMADRLTGHLKVDRTEVVRTVGERVLSKLYA